MWYTIPYSIFPCGADPSFPTGHTAKRPALQLDLLNGSKRLSGFAIIDSGADHCIFPLSFATQLGLDPLAMKGSSVAGLGGVSNTLYWPVRLEFPGTTLQLDVYAGFSASMDAIGAGFGLLGQRGLCPIGRQQHAVLAGQIGVPRDHTPIGRLRGIQREHGRDRGRFRPTGPVRILSDRASATRCIGRSDWSSPGPHSNWTSTRDSARAWTR